MKTRTVLVLVLIVAAAGCLVGAFRFPFMYSEFTLPLPVWIPDAIASRVRTWLITAGRIPVGEQYLWGVICTLFTKREYFVGWAIVLFSVIFPVLKIVFSAALAIGAPFVSVRSRERLLWGLSATAKWSMADVFIVGMIIVFFKAEGFHFAFEARAGVYCYAAAAVLSSLAVSVVRHSYETLDHDRCDRLHAAASHTDQQGIRTSGATGP